MSGSSRPKATAGFMLFEALIAVAVAGLVLAAFVRTHAVARKAALLPADIIEPSAVAQLLLSEWSAHPASLTQNGARSGYSYFAQVTPLQLVPLRTSLAPPLVNSETAKQAPAAGAQRAYEMRSVELHVRAQGGRQLIRETIGVWAP